MIQCLENYPDKPYRDHINDIIEFICQVDFPFHYPELADYLLKQFNQISELTQNPDMLLSDATSTFLQTVKIILTSRLSKKGSNKNAFLTVYYEYIKAFHPFWDNFHTSLKGVIESTDQNNIPQARNFLKLLRYADRIYMSFFCSAPVEMVEE